MSVVRELEAKVVAVPVEEVAGAEAGKDQGSMRASVEGTDHDWGDFLEVAVAFP